MDNEREAAAPIAPASASLPIDPLKEVFDDPPVKLPFVVPWPTFNTEQYSLDFVKELLPLLFLHWKEIASDSDIPLKPIWEHYEKASKGGALRIYTIRHTGALVGYSIFTVLPNSHYGDSVQANNDIIWLDPSLRGKLVGYKFIRWCDRQLRILDKVQKVRHHVKVAHNWGKILERQGYVADEIVYTKRLDLDPELNPVEISEDERAEGGDA